MLVFPLNKLYKVILNHSNLHFNLFRGIDEKRPIQQKEPVQAIFLNRLFSIIVHRLCNSTVKECKFHENCATLSRACNFLENCAASARVCNFHKNCATSAQACNFPENRAASVRACNFTAKLCSRHSFKPQRLTRLHPRRLQRWINPKDPANNSRHAKSELNSPDRQR